MAIRVGIDLGTTYCAVARIDDKTGKAVIIRNNRGVILTPSVLCFNEDGSILHGEDAKKQQKMGNQNIASFFKRCMGIDGYSLMFFGRRYSATDLSAILLNKLKIDVEKETNDKVIEAVITVPAYFDDMGKSATMAAARQAGLNCNIIISEPTAAALAYNLSKDVKEQTILVYDLGGGTFDVTIARVTGDEIDVLGTDGDHSLGGKDWDDCIVRYISDEFDRAHGLRISADPQKTDYLLVMAEDAKKCLSDSDSTSVEVKYEGKELQVCITVDTFESISRYQLGITKDLVNNLLNDLGLTWRNIDGVILVGGSTRMQMVRKYVKEMSGKEPLGGVNPDEAVALGAAIRANTTADGVVLPSISATIGGSTHTQDSIQGAKKIRDVAAHSLGMIAASIDGDHFINSIIIRKNTKIPVEETRQYKHWIGKDCDDFEIYLTQGEFGRFSDDDETYDEDWRPLNNTINRKCVANKKQFNKTANSESIIAVTYSYTINDTIEVKAIQTETGKELVLEEQPVSGDLSWTDEPPVQKKYGRGARQSLEIVFAIDTSGSMYGDPLKAARQAIIDFQNQLGSHNILYFETDSRGHSYIDFCEVRKCFSGNSNCKRYIVVLADGQWWPKEEAKYRAKLCKDEGIDIIAVGFGYADKAFLNDIASKKGFAKMTDLAGLSGTFISFAQEIENRL